MTPKRNKEEIENIINQYGYILLRSYIKNQQTKIIITDKCGYKYDVNLSDLMKCHQPHIVNTSNPYTLENISIWLKINDKSFMLCKDNVYNGVDIKLFFFCFICKSVFSAYWEDIYHSRGCAVCAGRQVGETTSLAYLRPKISKEWLKSEHNKFPEEVSEFSNEKVFWKCSVCGHEWWAIVCDRTGKIADAQNVQINKRIQSCK